MCVARASLVGEIVPHVHAHVFLVSGRSSSATAATAWSHRVLLIFVLASFVAMSHVFLRVSSSVATAHGHIPCRPLLLSFPSSRRFISSTIAIPYLVVKSLLSASLAGAGIFTFVRGTLSLLPSQRAHFPPCPSPRCLHHVFHSFCDMVPFTCLASLDVFVTSPGMLRVPSRGGGWFSSPGSHHTLISAKSLFRWLPHPSHFACSRSLGLELGCTGSPPRVVAIQNAMSIFVVGLPFFVVVIVSCIDVVVSFVQYHPGSVPAILS